MEASAASTHKDVAERVAVRTAQLRRAFTTLAGEPPKSLAEFLAKRSQRTVELVRRESSFPSFRGLVLKYAFFLLSFC